MGPDEKTREARIEPLFDALEEKPAVKGRLAWKLVWAGLALVGLIGLAIQQSF
jgi:hypothetical protein